MSAAPRILLVEDEANMVRTLTKILERKGYVVDAAATGEAALQRFAERSYDLLITDLNMPVMDGLQLLREMKERHIAPATIVLTGHGTIQSAVEAMKLGAGDYLIKPCHPDELLLVAARLLELRQLRREVQYLRTQLSTGDRYGELIGKSSRMREIYEVIEAVSQNKSNVLLSGENGTGKELVARTIHNKGPLAGRPFLAINCGALSETLLESQLFGHRRGSFTSAIDDHEGVFQAADGGTLFLDEITDIPLPLQVKFLRAIQEKEVTPLGSTRPIRVDVRIIAATNRDIEAAVKDGSFRTDLFYRLNVVPIHLPPLRERREDIPSLVDHFISEYSRIYGVEPKWVRPEALHLLVEYAWPGNIRELQNAIERAFALSSQPEITPKDLPAAILRGAEPASDGLGDPLPLEEVERRNILAALQRSGGNKNEAARILGIDRQRLYRKIEKYGLDA
ncbi:MAG TPA: sigma-54 dependent transcriptional regulator [Candidatus Margulisiibacteriota bacterium]|nr:sigma-54 dependent transcriptional regulator [Candidatus Margulisiibacteriota bacterium]